MCNLNIINCKLRESTQKWAASQTAGRPKKCYDFADANQAICNIFHQKCLFFNSIILPTNLFQKNDGGGEGCPFHFSEKQFHCLIKWIG